MVGNSTKSSIFISEINSSHTDMKFLYTIIHIYNGPSSKSMNYTSNNLLLSITVIILPFYQ
jgi:hypothetical protein